MASQPPPSSPSFVRDSPPPLSPADSPPPRSRCRLTRFQREFPPPPRSRRVTRLTPADFGSVQPLIEASATHIDRTIGGKQIRSRMPRPKLQASTEAVEEGAADQPSSLIEEEAAGDGAADQPSSLIEEEAAGDGAAGQPSSLTEEEAARDGAAGQPSSLTEEEAAGDGEADQPSSLIEEEAVGDGLADQPFLIEEEKEPAPFSDAPSPVRAVLNRPWPALTVIPPTSPSGKFRTLVATARDIGPPISPEELAALEDKEGDDQCTRNYKAAARANAAMRNYIHEHGSLYEDENFELLIDNSALLEEIRCKNVTAEEMEAKILKKEVTSVSTDLSELALACYNKKRKVKFELCELLLSRSFWEDRGFFVHLNFVAKRKDKKKLFFAEIEDCGRRNGEIFEVRCCVSLDSVCEGGYYNLYVPTPPGSRKGLDFSRCHACTEWLKHPGDGLLYTGGHDCRKRTYLF